LFAFPLTKLLNLFSFVPWYINRSWKKIVSLTGRWWRHTNTAVAVVIDRANKNEVRRITDQRRRMIVVDVAIKDEEHLMTDERCLDPFNKIYKRQW